jgi:iron(III) transport system ATP-binding protein
MIRVEGLRKNFAAGKVPVLRGVSFSVERTEVYTLLGPSGCGKTTSMRCIAGLENPDEGAISLNGRPVFSAPKRINLPPAERDIGMVFQSYAIWPHMTVAQNVAYPLEGRRLSGSEKRHKVERALELVGLHDLSDRPAPNLSGGQQQRVAFARAIVAEPNVLLLDEPLSNLDAKLREQMRTELMALQRRLGHTIVYVTHDQEEALALSNRVALMNAGEIVEEGDPVTLYQYPRRPFTAAFLGAANFIPCADPGRVRDGEKVEVETAFGRFIATARRGDDRVPRLFFRPHHTTIAPRAANGQGNCRVTHATFLGETVDIEVAADDQKVRLRTRALGLPEGGAPMAFTIDPDFSIAFLPDVV